VLAKVPDLAELVEESAADISDLAIDRSANAEVAVEFETDDGDVVEVPADADDAIVLEGQGRTLEIALPGGGSDAEVVGDGSVVYEDAMPDTDFVVQAQEDGGVRMIAVLDGRDAPSRFDFRVRTKRGNRLEVGADGSAAVVDRDDFVVAYVEAPWAYDAAGNEVPSFYTVRRNKLVLNVDHSQVKAYPVVADPRWTWGWISGTAYFSRWETTQTAGNAAIVTSYMAAIPTGFSQVVAWYALNIAAWATTALLYSRKCLKVKYGMTWSWKGASPGVTPGHYTLEAGVRCR